jgi:hypothetical protein
MDRQRFSHIAHSTHIFYNPLREAKLMWIIGLAPSASCANGPATMAGPFQHTEMLSVRNAKR